jgi:hypothetical protein
MDEQEKKKEIPHGVWRRSFPTFRYILFLPTKRWFIKCVCIFMILLCVDLTLAWWWRHIPISYQTTRIPGPLNPDGTVDYVAALNAQYGKGVTPDNNAVVDIWQATGMERFPKRVMQKYFQLLGVPTISQPAKPFEYYDSYFQTDPSNSRNKNTEVIYGHVTSAPFTSRQYPQVAAWLKAQHAARDLYLAASEKTYWYEPMVNSSPTFQVMSILLPSLAQLRNLTNMMQIDAMERLGQGDVSGAWTDAFAIHRLALLEMKSPFLICQLVAFTVEATAGSIDQEIIAHGRLRADQADDMLQDLQSLQEFPNYSESVFDGERYAQLDFLQSLARGHGDLEDMIGAGPNVPTLILDFLPIHYSVMMSDINQHIDQINKAIASDTYAKAKPLLDALNPQITMRGNLLAGSWPELWLGELIMPSYSPFVERYFANLAILPLTQTEFALAAWHADHGGYPKTLAELIPQYLTSVPIDPFDGQPLRYQQTNGGYKLWSIGYTQTNPNPNVYSEDFVFTLHRDLEFTMPASQKN